MTTRRGDLRLVIGGLSAGLVLLLACTRSAEQNNYLGRPCANEGDCPADLVCRANFCRALCGADGTCAAGSACQDGVCIPSGSPGTDGPGTSVDGGGGRPNTAADSGGSAPNDPGEPETDGQLVLSSFSEPSSAGATAADDAFGAYIEETLDVFQQRTRKLMAVPFGSSTPADVYTFAEQEETPMEMLALNGSVYFALRSNEMPNSNLVSINLTTKEKKTIAACDNGFVRLGTKIAFTQNDNLRLYDTAGAGTLDPTNYGSVMDVGGKHMLVSLQGTQLTWLDRTSSWVVKQATLGSPGAATGRTLPGTANIAAFAAVGNDGIVVLDSGSPATVLKMKLNDNSATVPAGTIAIARDIFAEDGSLFFVDDSDKFQGTGGSAKVTKMTVDGTKTAFGNVDNVNAMYTTPSSVLLSVPTGSGTKPRLYKWAKP